MLSVTPCNLQLTSICKSIQKIKDVGCSIRRCNHGFHFHGLQNCGECQLYLIFDLKANAVFSHVFMFWLGWNGSTRLFSTVELLCKFCISSRWFYLAQEQAWNIYPAQPLHEQHLYTNQFLQLKKWSVNSGLAMSNFRGYMKHLFLPILLKSLSSPCFPGPYYLHMSLFLILTM